MFYVSRWPLYSEEIPIERPYSFLNGTGRAQIFTKSDIPILFKTLIVCIVKPCSESGIRPQSLQPSSPSG